jgi:hypothetical protein
VKATSKILTSLYIFYSFSAAATIIPSGFGSESNFYDNGVVTTEYENGVAVREWLDLTITNGISYNSVFADLEDDNIINASPNGFNANLGAITDIATLASNQSENWELATFQQVNGLINDFFGINFNPTLGSYIFRDVDGYRTNTLIVEQFIKLFGDTWHEGRTDVGASDPDVNPTLENIGFNAGYAATETAPPFDLRSFRVTDGQYSDNSTDSITDSIDNYSRNPSTRRYEIGTWLVRDVQIVSEPKTILILLLGLLISLLPFRQSA